MQAIARVNRVYKDKEAGLIVDYIGIGADLRNALNEYTNRDRDKVPDITAAYVIVKEKPEVMRDFFYGFDYQETQQSAERAARRRVLRRTGGICADPRGRAGRRALHQATL